jgi:hypothetical protein
VNHHENPLDMRSPEFEGLAPDEALDLKKQLRIRDRNRAIRDRHRALTERRAAEREAAGKQAGVAFASIVVITLLGILFLCFSLTA